MVRNNPPPSLWGLVGLGRKSAWRVDPPSMFPELGAVAGRGIKKANAQTRLGRALVSFPLKILHRYRRISLKKRSTPVRQWEPP